MLNALAELVHAKLTKKLSKKPTYIESKIALYENALALKFTSFPELTSHENYQMSFHTLLDMYRSGELDGSKVTYVCEGKVIELNPGEREPFYTIIDQPNDQPSLQQ